MMRSLRKRGQTKALTHMNRQKLLTLEAAVQAIVEHYGGVRAAERATGVDKSFISRLMNGHKVSPSADTLAALGLRAVPLYEVLRHPNPLIQRISEMETFTQPKITGYRQLTPEVAELMNEGKALAERCGAYIAKLRTHPDSEGGNVNGDTDLYLDQRWISIGATDLQRGFMAVIRGIAQPTTF